MSGACAASAGGTGYIGSFSGFLDCRAEMLDTSAFGALSAPGSTLSLLLAGFLTIFVAIIGYNLLAGRNFTVRSGTMAMVKVGVVLTLATSWPAYKTLVYDVAVDGPAQLAAEIGRAAGMPGSDGTLVQRLDAADGALQQLAILGPGQLDFGQAQSVTPPPTAGFDAFALGGSRILFLLSALLGIVGVRIVAALMLALGPYFIALLLFEGTRTLFDGWVRVLAGAALAALTVSLCLGFELALLEPWLSNVLARRVGGEALPTVPTELFVTIGFFACTMAAAIFASIKLTSAFRLAWAPFERGAPTGGRLPDQHRQLLAAARGERASEPPSRASLTASVIATMQRREAAGSSQPAEIRVAARSYSRMESQAAATQSFGPTTPTGRAFPRRTGMRATSSAARRDRTA